MVSFALADKEADVWASKVKYSIWETEILIKTPLGMLQARSASERLLRIGLGFRMLGFRVGASPADVRLSQRRGFVNSWLLN